MPNNPGRIEGDYSIGEHETIRYTDPGNYGQIRVKKTNTSTYFLVLFAVALILIIFAFR